MNEGETSVAEVMLIKFSSNSSEKLKINERRNAKEWSRA